MTWPGLGARLSENVLPLGPKNHMPKTFEGARSWPAVYLKEILIKNIYDSVICFKFFLGSLQTNYSLVLYEEFGSAAIVNIFLLHQHVRTKCRGDGRRNI